MTTYSFIQYDVLTGGMYFKGTPTPDLNIAISEGSISSVNTKEYLQYIKTEGQLPLNQSASQAIINYLDTVSEIDLNNSKTIILTIPIIDDVEMGDGVKIVSKNLDGTKTYVTKNKFNLAVEYIKPGKKWQTMDKNCPNCIKASFFGTGSSSGSLFNFTGDIGGQYAGAYINGQKSYYLSIPNYSTAAGYGTIEQYTIFWKPNVTYSGTDYAGTPINIVNQHKWIATPTANIGTPQELSNKTFFHVSSMFTASCPVYDPTPTTTPFWNFRGNQGFFQLNSVNLVVLPETPTLGKLCPIFTPNPGNVDWGYNCAPIIGCVSALSGSIGLYPTIEACISSSCLPGLEPTSSEFGYNCVNGCIPGTEANPGEFALYYDCVESGCSDQPIVNCPCDQSYNLVQNSNFANGSTNWNYSPIIYNSLIGSINFSSGYIQAETVAPLSSLTSSLFVTQSNVFTPSCSYSICFQAWQVGDNPTAVISVNGDLVTNLGLSQTPTAQTFTYTADTTDLIFYFGVSSGGARINVDNICVTLLSCPPNPEEDCTIVSGSASTYEAGTFDLPCSCPNEYEPDGNGNCIASGSILVNKIITGTSITANPITHPSWGINCPALYYGYNITGIGSNSISPGTPTTPNNPSPLFGNPNVHNTQYTFDLLKAPFWRGYSSNFNDCGLSAQLFRQISLNGNWVGGGSFIDIPSTKTYYVALIADDSFRFKLDGNIIVQNTNQTQGDDLSDTLVDANRAYLNPYITSNLTNDFGGNWTYRNLHIYPVTMTAGCHFLTLEGRDTNQTIAGFGGLILDNTAEEIAAAQNQYQLNIIWDSRTDLIFDLNAGIVALCPPNTTPLGSGNCDKCIASGSIVPCGDCLDCFNGSIYNGYVVDKGGSSVKGRGPGGIVNINANDNPINTWIIPGENEWNTLVTYLDGGTTPPTVTQTGSFGTIVGGKLKEYTRDSIATCWEFPNAGSTTSANNSGWSGTPAGKRDEYGNFSGLGFDGYWWSANSLSTPPTSNGNKMATRELKHYSSDVFRNIYTKNEGHSIRLVRPAETNEANGATIFDAYKGNDDKLYDGIVIGTQVWITKNLNETRYNNNTNIPLTSNTQTWINSLNTGYPTSCYYLNSSSYSSSLEGNIDPATGECYQFPPLYIYQNCTTSELLLQTVPGGTTTPGKVQKSPDGTCWSFVEETTLNNDNYIASIYTLSNYFSGSNYVYNNCNECEAIHTIYMKFGTKNC